MNVAASLNGSMSHGGQVLFRDLSLSLPAGEWTCLLGSSGVGKSTILKLLAGLPTGGDFQGNIIASDGASVSAQTAYMAQSDLLFPWLDVRGNVLLGSRLRGEEPDVSRAEALIREIGLQSHIGKRPHQLSGGMRQRAALARTLMEDTPIVLLDEPFSALDTRTRREMQNLAFDMLKGKTVLLVTHDSAEALRLAHRLFVMSTGGLQEHAIEAGPALRALDSDECIDSQSRLLLTLNSSDVNPLPKPESEASPLPQGDESMDGGDSATQDAKAEG